MDFPDLFRLFQLFWGGGCNAKQARDLFEWSRFRFPPPAPIAFIAPRVYIIAGPNGAGKTTFAREFLPNYAGCKNFSMPIRLHKVFRHSDAVSVRRDD